MTMPHLMNCGHSDTGWCLTCVHELNARLESEQEAHARTLERLKSCQKTRDQLSGQNEGWHRRVEQLNRDIDELRERAEIADERLDKKCVECGDVSRRLNKAEVELRDLHTTLSAMTNCATDGRNWRMMWHQLCEQRDEAIRNAFDDGMRKAVNAVCEKCGDRSPSAVYTSGREYDLTTHSGALRWRVRCAIESMKNWPGNVRWRFANRLSRMAMRLRGDKTLEGFHVLQNQAASLEDSIFHPLICTGESVTLTKEECDDIIEAAHKLGKLANATSYVDYWRKSQ